MDFDRFDGRILLELQREGRLPVVELAELIGSRRSKRAESSKAMPPS
jgi:DNA-binding Lrp family transcriptional regulator